MGEGDQNHVPLSILVSLVYLGFFILIHFRYSEAVETIAAEFLKRVDNLNRRNVYVIKGTERKKANLRQ